MNYEELYQNLLPMEKRLKDVTSTAQKLYKTISKDTESGDLKDLNKILAAFEELIKEEAALIQSLQGTVDGFDSRAYFENGEFASQLLDICREMNVNVTGEYPVFEMFPYKVRIDTENQDIYVDRKKVPCMRPQSFAQTVKSGQDRLMKAQFNAQAFVNELAEAYDMAILKTGKSPESDLYLTNLYKFLVPMSRSRKEYDQQNFAYDLARLYASDVTETKNGRRFQFGPSRDNNKAIRILDGEGREQFLAMIRFFAG